MSLDSDLKCRTCMGESSSYHQLYDYIDDNYKILEMLDDIVPQIHIKTESFAFSHLVCQMCVDKLLAGYKFQQLCIETNNRLHEMFKDETVEGGKIAEKEPELDKVLDPLKGVESIKMKQELDESIKYECEINPEDISVAVKSDDDLETDDGGVPTKAVGMDDSASDSSNEKLSVLRERKLSKSSRFLKVKKRCKKVRLKTEFPCKECGKIFDRLYRLKRHGAVHVKKGAYSCDICKYSFAAEKTYASHMLLHNTEGNEGTSILQVYSCEHCPKTFEKKAAYIQHSQTHSKDKDTDVPKKRGRKKGVKNRSKDEKDANNKSDVWEDVPLACSHLADLSNENKESDQTTLETQNIIDIKEEMELPQHLYRDSAEDIDENVEWFKNEDDSDYTDCEEDEADDVHQTDVGKNVDFVDTGIGEIEKLPNTRNRRNGNYPCEVCGKIFDRPYRLKRHRSVHSLERPHACEFCKYRFATANLLKIHLMQHESESGGNLVSQSRPDGFKCPDCPRRFEKQASLSAHRQIHTRNASEANYPCAVCQRNFMSVRSLTEHISNKHPEVEKHKCDQCEKTFVLHAHLVEHLNRHKGNKNLVCLICEKEFGYTNTLKEHMRTHSGESPFLCPQCGKTFRSSSNLRQHMERHFGLKKYQCPECPSRFNCRSDLIKHMSTHTNAKPHVCDVCGSRFTRAYSLQKHKLLHSGERPFKCDQCNMTFAIIYHLRRHMRTHTGEKPYKCKYCDRAYAESGDLTKHLRTHVGENTYMCDQCPMAFKYHQELRQHVSEHYKMAQQLLTHAQHMSDEAQKLEDDDHENVLLSMEHSSPNQSMVPPPPAHNMDLVGGC